MTTRGQKEPRNLALRRVLRVMNDLIAGKKHDRRTIADMCAVTPQTADRDIRALERLQGVKTVKDGKRRYLQFDPSVISGDSQPPRQAHILAACLGMSIASIFEGTPYERGMRDAVGYMVERAKRRKKFSNIERKFIFVRQGGEVALNDRAGELDELIEAILRCRWVKIDYSHFNGKRESVRVKPLSLAIYDHQLYVISSSAENSLHPYRFSRIASVDMDDEVFEYPERSEYDPLQVFMHSFGIFIGAPSQPTDVEVLLDSKWATYVSAHRWHPSQKIRRVDGGVIVSLHVRICPEVERWILGFGADARVLKPASLVATMRERVAEMAKIHGFGITPTGSASTKRRHRKVMDAIRKGRQAKRK